MLGALSLLALPARWSSLTRYVVTGSLNELISLGIACGSLTPTTFIVGTLTSNFTTGICCAGITGLVLHLAGQTGRRQGNRYALVNSLRMLSTIYMITLEVYGAGHYGTRAAAWIDAGG